MDPKDSPPPPNPDTPPPEATIGQSEWLLPDVQNLSRREKLDLYFNDPFKGRERKFYWFVLPALLAGVVLLIVLLLLLPAPYDNVEKQALAVQNTEKPPTAAEILQASADRATAENRFSDAEVFLREITTLEPSSLTAWNNLAVVNFALKRTAESLDAAEKALAINPDSEPPRFNRTILLRETGQQEKALEDLRFLAAKSPSNVRYATHLTLLRLQTKDPDVAGEITTYKNNAPPSLERFWLLGAIGLACERGQFDEAEALLDRARRIFDAAALEDMLTDPFFDPYRKTLGLKTRNQSAPFRDVPEAQ